MSNKSNERVVTKCDDCPGLISNYGVRPYCRFEDKSWGEFSAFMVEPAPDWCPLRKNSIVIRLEETKTTKV